jgi:prolyl 4-hydroxylase
MASQAVTPELRQWIVSQAAAGQGAQQVLESMLASGWNEDVAIAAMEETLQQHLQAQGVPVPVLVPEPMVEGMGAALDAGDRQVQVIAALREPRILVFADLASAAECEALIEAARPRLERSLTVAVDDGSDRLHEDRTSSGMFFTRGETELVRCIEERIARLLAWPVQNGEGLQVLQYLPGAQYKPHHDFFDPGETGTPALVQRGGQRVATLILYLNEPRRGGATVFPEARLDVLPRRGHAVFFSYDRPHASTRTLHGGAPVLEGEKWIATKWLREREYV